MCCFFIPFFASFESFSRDLTNDTTEFLIKSRTRVRIFNPLFFLILSHCVRWPFNSHPLDVVRLVRTLTSKASFSREFYPTAINLSVHLIIVAYYYEHNSHKCTWMTTTLRWLSERAKVRLLCAIHNLMIDDCWLFRKVKLKEIFLSLLTSSWARRWVVSTRFQRFFFCFAYVVNPRESYNFLISLLFLLAQNRIQISIHFWRF